MKNSRRRAREFALQGIYQWLVNESGADVLLAQFREQKDFHTADAALVEALLDGVVSDAPGLRERISPFLDRPIKELSPVEHALLLLAACTAELARLGVRSADITVATVPGALEIPLAVQKLAWSEKFDALIALGAVIRGETYHFEVVSNESASGIMAVQLDTGVPVANGILTTENDAQAAARVTEKGADCARVAVEMANLVKAIDEKQ